MRLRLDRFLIISFGNFVLKDQHSLEPSTFAWNVFVFVSVNSDRNILTNFEYFQKLRPQVFSYKY